MRKITSIVAAGAFAATALAGIAVAASPQLLLPRPSPRLRSHSSFLFLLPPS